MTKITFNTQLINLIEKLMIVRPHQHWLARIFVWHGSVLPKIYSRLLLNFLLSIVVVLLVRL